MTIDDLMAAPIVGANRHALIYSDDQRHEIRETHMTKEQAERIVDAMLSAYTLREKMDDCDGCVRDDADALCDNLRDYVIGRLSGHNGIVYRDAGNRKGV